MDMQSQKLELIQWLAGINDPKLISKFLNLKKDAISEEDLLIDASIDRGLEDIKNGRTTPHDQIRKKYEKWL